MLRGKENFVGPYLRLVVYVVVQLENASVKRKLSPEEENEKLRTLLDSACRILDEYFPDSDVMPARVQEWWLPRKRAIVQELIDRSEAGVADAALSQIITDESELVSDCC